MNSITTFYLINLIGCFAILVFSLLSLWFRVKRGLLLTGVSGLFMSASLFLGIGPICYMLSDISWELMTTAVVSRYQAEIIPFVATGFFLVFANEFRKRKKGISKNKIELTELKASYFKVVIFFFVISLIGYFLSQTEIANSGIGTFFPVFRLFLYPSIILAVYQVKVTRPVTIIVACIILSLGFYLTLMSVWRSQLILFFLSFAIGLLQRSRKFTIPVVLGAFFIVLLLLPFQHLKKTDYYKVKANLSGSFVKTLNLPLSERLKFAGLFFAERINYGREIAYVNHAIHQKWLRLRNGETYGEMVLQAVPRSLWPGKPSFNYYTNYYLPRRIGLVGEEDDYTSWGVNVYAEFIMNFNRVYLLGFIPLLFWVVAGIDKFISNKYQNTLVKWVVQTSFFFITFEMVGIVNVSTFVIWMLIVAKLSEVIFKMRFKRSLSNTSQYPV